MYTLKHVERNNRPQGNNWSTRQTIVYHQKTGEVNGTEIWIFLHPKPESVFHKRIMNGVSDVHKAWQLFSRPLNVHLLLLSCYIENWRWYLAQLSETFADAVGRTDREQRSIANRPVVRYCADH